MSKGSPTIVVNKNLWEQLKSQLQAKDEEIETLKNELVSILYQTEVFKPIAIANSLRQFVRLNIPDYRNRQHEIITRRIRHE